jgi:hypothetical protein
LTLVRKRRRRNLKRNVKIKGDLVNKWFNKENLTQSKKRFTHFIQTKMNLFQLRLSLPYLKVASVQESWKYPHNQ